MGSPRLFFFDPIRTTDITWNFEKILIDSTGKPFRRYAPAVPPDAMREDIEELLTQLRQRKAKAKKLAQKKASLKTTKHKTIKSMLGASRYTNRH